MTCSEQLRVVSLVSRIDRIVCSQRNPRQQLTSTRPPTSVTTMSTATNQGNQERSRSDVTRFARGSAAVRLPVTTSLVIAATRLGWVTRRSDRRGLQRDRWRRRIRPSSDAVETLDGQGSFRVRRRRDYRWFDCDLLSGNLWFVSFARRCLIRFVRLIR